MKLVSKYNRTTLLATIIVLLVSGACYYSMIRYVLIHQLDKDLKVEEQEINDNIKNNNRLPPTTKERDQWVEFSLSNNTIKRAFSSYSVFDKNENEDDSRRQLVFPVGINGIWYSASVSKSQVETEYLLKLIFLITLGLLLLLLLTLFMVNRLLLSKLWHPFNTTLQALKQFRFSDGNGLRLGTTKIEEFRELNESVIIMTERIRNDYMSLKRFTENASHEMQTPLAVIYSKLDLLIQHEGFDQLQTRHLQDIYASVTKLTRLNKSLLLLNKIENNQFIEKETVNLDILLTEKLQQFEELIQQKQLLVDARLNQEVIHCNRELLDILIGNLLNNAIRYNRTEGLIAITVSPHLLQIANRSSIPQLDKGALFQRFYRHSETKQEGNGLGLSIVKQICEVEGFELDYHYHNDRHQFSVRFPVSLKTNWP